MNTEHGQNIRVQSLPPGTRLQVQTDSRTYELELLGEGDVLISGHPRHCPQPVMAHLCDGYSKDPCIMEGTPMKYFHPDRGVIRTSRVRKVTPLLT